MRMEACAERGECGDGRDHCFNRSAGWKIGEGRRMIHGRRTPTHSSWSTAAGHRRREDVVRRNSNIQNSNWTRTSREELKTDGNRRGTRHAAFLRPRHPARRPRTPQTTSPREAFCHWLVLNAPAFMSPPLRGPSRL